MDRAFLGHSEKVLPLRGAQVTCQRQRRTQAIDAVAFLAGIALHGNLDTLHWNPLMFRVPKHGQRLARAQRGIVEVMGTWPQPLSALLDTEVGGKTVSSDVNFMPHRRSLISNDSNRDRKSTRLNSSHSQISYAVFCLKKKKNNYTT